MGRKPKAAKLESTTEMPKKSHGNSIFSPSKKMESKSTGGLMRRRSGRIMNKSPIGNQHSVPEEIDLVESEKEEEQQQPPASEPTKIEEKTDNDVQIQTKEELKSKARKRNSSNKEPSTGVDYEKLYLESQKKIEALTSDNQELAKKLELSKGKLDKIDMLTSENELLAKLLGLANGKLEEYEKKKDESLKKEELMAGLVKAAEAIVNLSSSVSKPLPAVRKKPSPMKKKKLFHSNGN